MKKQKNNIIKLILNNNKVNNYTKLMILLQTWDYFEDYYIPNRKIMNILNINKKNTIRILRQLQNDHIIAIFYKGRKRYFTFTGFNYCNEETQKNLEEKEDIFSYDWLNSED